MHAYQPDRLAPETEKNGFVQQVLGEHPALIAGAAASLVVMLAIFANAIFYQPSSHPSPLFATRDDVKAPAALSTAQRDQKPAKVAKKSVGTSPEVLREVQAALSVRGYYKGTVDGKYGSRTRAAIEAFQNDHDLKKDGKASARLLTEILLSASAQPKQVPVPEPRNASISDQKVGSIAVPDKPRSTATEGLVARIQAGLKNYGYEDLVVDGKSGRQTRSAIQSFQLDYGMKITGEPTEEVLQKLEEIGAYRQG